MTPCAGSYPASETVSDIDAATEIGLRLAAIRQWCEYARTGRVPESRALFAISALVDAIEAVAAA